MYLQKSVIAATRSDMIFDDGDDDGDDDDVDDDENTCMVLVPALV